MTQNPKLKGHIYSSKHMYIRGTCDNLNNENKFDICHFESVEALGDEIIKKIKKESIFLPPVDDKCGPSLCKNTRYKIKYWEGHFDP